MHEAAAGRGPYRQALEVSPSCIHRDSHSLAREMQPPEGELAVLRGISSPCVGTGVCVPLKNARSRNSATTAAVGPKRARKREHAKRSTRARRSVPLRIVGFVVEVEIDRTRSNCRDNRAIRGPPCAAIVDEKVVVRLVAASFGEHLAGDDSLRSPGLCSQIVEAVGAADKSYTGCLTISVECAIYM